MRIRYFIVQWATVRQRALRQSAFLQNSGRIRYFNDRLKSIFAAVADEPKVLRNSANSPLYLLCFAAGNPKGAPIALRIASHLLKRGTE